MPGVERETKYAILFIDIKFFKVANIKGKYVLLFNDNIVFIYLFFSFNYKQSRSRSPPVEKAPLHYYLKNEPNL